MVTLIGKDEVLANLNKAIKEIKGRNLHGMTVAANLIKTESEKLTPVATGNLKGSHYLEDNANPDDPIVEVGVTAEYGVYVHENLEAQHTNGQAKFLETAIKENVDMVLKVIQNRVEV